MVELVAARGLRNPAVLAALLAVPRHMFVPERLAEFAYEDSALSIDDDEMLLQPFVVATMAEASGVEPTERALVLGNGAGYTAAVLSRIAGEVVTVQRRASLASFTRNVLRDLGYDNVRVAVGEGVQGSPDLGPYDAIVSSTPGPGAPRALLDQLVDGGRLVVPVGGRRTQTLRRIVRDGDRLYRQDLGDVRFVPLIGRDAWTKEEKEESWTERLAHRDAVEGDLPPAVAEVAEPFDSVLEGDLGRLLDRIGDARVVLLGESTRGSSELQRVKARITAELVLRSGFDTLVFDADWRDAAWIDRAVRDSRPDAAPGSSLVSGAPTWTLRTLEIEELIAWLRAHNLESEPAREVAVFGLDLYGMHRSIEAVIDYLEGCELGLAAEVRRRHDHLTPWHHDPTTYREAVSSDLQRGREAEILSVLNGMLDQRLTKDVTIDDRLFEALQATHVLADAERYYRALYYGAREAWNLRERHMFETLRALLRARGPESKAVVWAHNSHVGDASATELGARGETSIGELCRIELEEPVYILGFTTDHGQVTAATSYDGPPRIMELGPSHPESYEHVLHECHHPSFLLPMRAMTDALRDKLREPRIERVVGLVYRPEAELERHYFSASLPLQFDEVVHIDRTRATRVLSPRRRRVRQVQPPGLTRRLTRSASSRGGTGSSSQKG